MQPRPSSRRPQTFASADLGVASIDAALPFYTDSAGLRLVERTEEAAYLAVGAEHHCLVLHQAEQPGLQRLTYEVADLATLEALADRLRAAGTMVEDAPPSPYAAQALRFSDPEGFPLEMVVAPQQHAAPPPPGRVQFRKLLHPLLDCVDLQAMRTFYTDVLGFQVSDFIGDVAVFLRCADGYHHSLALQKAERAQIDHLCYLVEDLDGLMRSRSRLRARGSEIGSDVVRHGGSNSISYYFPDPHSGIDFEYCTGHAIITDEFHVPRRLLAAPTTFDMWQDH
jgi:2,3-dihydroxy-p-cumate/2,3-dihydroxybenzoate 3,4-dioxygenase